MLLLDHVVLLVSVEAGLEELVEVGGVQYGHVHVTVDEHIVEKSLFAVVAVFVEVPDVFGGREGGMIIVEALDPSVAVFVAVVVRPRVPEVHMAVHHENFFSVH